MKFRYKVLITNIILLSIALGTIGYLMIRKNFKLALDTQVKNAITENNLAQSSIEYTLLDALNSSNYNLSHFLSNVGERVSASLISSESSIAIRYKDTYIYSTCDTILIPEELFENTQTGSKKYIISDEEDGHYIYISSYSVVDSSFLNIITRRNIEDAYNLMNSQSMYFRLLLIIILLVTSFIMLLISILLTRPLERLNIVTKDISNGKYGEQISINSSDEVGELSTSFNHMSSAIKEHTDNLEEMIKRREQFVADFTHEIKTPMTTIIGYADTMRSIKLSHEDEMMSLNYIYSEGKRLETMSRKLFDLIYLSQNEIEFSNIDITKLINNIKKSVIPALTAKSIELIENIEAGTIEGDYELLQSAIINIIDNARKASDEGSKLEITGINNEDYYLLSIKDYGCGMTEEDAKHICNEFYMVDKSRSRKEGGAGLGMSLVAKILEKHNARLNVESKLNEGTKMTISFKKGGLINEE